MDYSMKKAIQMVNALQAQARTVGCLANLVTVVVSALAPSVNLYLHKPFLSWRKLVLGKKIPESTMSAKVTCFVFLKVDFGHFVNCQT